MVASCVGLTTFLVSVYFLSWRSGLQIEGLALAYTLSEAVQLVLVRIGMQLETQLAGAIFVPTWESFDDWYEYYKLVLSSIDAFVKPGLAYLAYIFVAGILNKDE